MLKTLFNTILNLRWETYNPSDESRGSLTSKLNGIAKTTSQHSWIAHLHYFFLFIKYANQPFKLIQFQKLTSCISWVDSVLPSPPSISPNSDPGCNQSTSKNINLSATPTLLNHRHGKKHKETETAISHETRTVLSIRKGRIPIMNKNIVLLSKFAIFSYYWIIEPQKKNEKGNLEHSYYYSRFRK